MAKGVTAAARPRKPISAATQALLNEMREDASKPVPESKLSEVRDKLREFRDIERRVADLEEQLSATKERRRVIAEKELVDLFDDARITSMALAAEGNLPAFEVEVGSYYHANIAVDWPEDKRRRAFGWLDKYHPGILRSTLTISFGKNTRKLQQEFERLAAKHKLAYKNEFGVPWNTLTAFVREQIEEHRRRPPLDLLGATVGRVAKIKKQKEK